MEKIRQAIGDSDDSDEFDRASSQPLSGGAAKAEKPAEDPYKYFLKKAGKDTESEEISGLEESLQASVKDKPEIGSGLVEASLDPLDKELLSDIGLLNDKGHSIPPE